MLKKLGELFFGSKDPVASIATRQAVPAAPNTPLEILVPEGARLHEAPRLAGTAMSFLVASPLDMNTIELVANERRIGSNNNELKQFLLMLAGANQMQALFSQCTAVMYAPTLDGSIGELACIQQGNLYSFAVFERSASPDIAWEIHRSVRPVQLDPCGPGDSFKPTPGGAA